MDLLFVDACMRGVDESRTHRICRAFLEAYQSAHPSASIKTVELSKLGLLPMDGQMVAERESLINAGKLDDARFELARDFQSAKHILIGAPYWDFSFPSALKVYIEHIFVRTVAFVYREDKPFGLCAGERVAYVATSGSLIGACDWGREYIRGVIRILGIERFDSVTAEGIDIANVDVEHLILDAEAQAQRLARDF